MREVIAYMVVLTGVAIGLRIFGLLNEADGLQEYCKPSVIALSCTWLPVQIMVSVLADKFTIFITLTLIESWFLQPLSFKSTLYEVVISGETRGADVFVFEIL